MLSCGTWFYVRLYFVIKWSYTVSTGLKSQPSPLAPSHSRRECSSPSASLDDSAKDLITRMEPVSIFNSFSPDRAFFQSPFPLPKRMKFVPTKMLDIEI